MVTALAPLLTPTTLITADAGYHSEDNLAALADRQVDALIADGRMRTRDERFTTQGRHRAAPDPLHNKTPAVESPALFQLSDFAYDAEARTCVSPAGNALYRKGKQLATKGHVADRFQGAKHDFDRFTLRGRTKVNGEWQLFCLVQNIEKLTHHGYAA